VGICRYSGGGMMLVPKADPQDGLLDITLIQKMSFWEVLLNLRYLYNSKIYEHPKARHFRAADIQVFPLQKEIPLEVDGEFLGWAPAQFSVLTES
jgi:diacylglycerol kinase (ATP)